MWAGWGRAAAPSGLSILPSPDLTLPGTENPERAAEPTAPGTFGGGAVPFPRGGWEVAGRGPCSAGGGGSSSPRPRGPRGPWARVGELPACACGRRVARRKLLRLTDVGETLITQTLGPGSHASPSRKQAMGVRPPPWGPAHRPLPRCPQTRRPPRVLGGALPGVRGAVLALAPCVARATRAPPCLSCRPPAAARDAPWPPVLLRTEFVGAGPIPSFVLVPPGLGEGPCVPASGRGLGPGGRTTGASGVRGHGPSASFSVSVGFSTRAPSCSEAKTV